MKRRRALNLATVLLAAGVALLFLSWVFGNIALWLVAAVCFGIGFYLLFARVLARRRRRRK